MKKSNRFYFAAALATIAAAILLSSSNGNTRMLAIPAIGVACTMIACATLAESKEWLAIVILAAGGRLFPSALVTLEATPHSQQNKFHTLNKTSSEYN